MPIPTSRFRALVFKIVSDPFVGRLAYMRVYSGTLRSNSSTYNSPKSRKERIGRLLHMYANRREDVDERLGGRYRRGRWAKVHLHRRHAV